MILYQVSYEFNDEWLTAGFEYAANGYEAIDLVRETTLDEIARKTGMNSNHILEEMNFDFCEVKTTSGVIVKK